MKTFVISPFYPVSDRVDESHRAGWARYWANEIGAELITTKTMDQVDSLKKGDQLMCYHGMEFKGQMNLQSGLTDEILMRARRLIAAGKRGVKLISLDHGMPNYGGLLAARGMDQTSSDSLTGLCAKAGRLLVPNPEPRLMVFGDSHALSLYRPESVIYRTDSLTMHGALGRGLFKMLDDFAFETEVSYDKVEVLTVYFGNIDIRHHLLRPDLPVTAMKDLVTAYGKQLVEVGKAYPHATIEVVLPLPIECESRPIPKSGWYKGTPFYGSWSDRHRIRKDMARMIRAMARKHGFMVYDHPRHFLDGDKLSFDSMEKPRSVHIRPAEYRLVQEDMGWAA